MSDSLTMLPPANEVRQLHDLSGKVAMVTGAGSGLGRAMAWGMACNGADIVIVDQDAAKARACADEIAAGSGRKTMSLGGDVSAEDDVRAAVMAALAGFGRVDILVNNAGHNIRKPVSQFSVDEFDSLHNVHVRGTFLFCKHLSEHMQQRGSGSIINISSMLGLIAAPGVAPYAAAKAAIAAFSRVFALEMAPHGVRVNAIAPGYIDTPLTRTHPDEVRARIINVTPMGRFGLPRELIGPMLFLASEASSFVTGTTLLVDGGWTAQ
ncbi:SDR family NAD(P)-dependent oxidoreductase [Lacisediminimonas sp.]|uniref:SDR family NAD(P)-dependent oxidoreductase n=1 Tax=Lacisediminimonas sp. TaxID=3060582 RepID=UPI00272CD3E7|nr:glucose 1-dehydrogenase [Lacisediminimonas sp.]